MTPREVCEWGEGALRSCGRGARGRLACANCCIGSVGKGRSSAGRFHFTAGPCAYVPHAFAEESVFVRRKRDTFDLPVRYGNVRRRCSPFVGTGVGFFHALLFLPSVFFCAVGRKEKEKRHYSTMNKQNNPPPPSVMVGRGSVGCWCFQRAFLLSEVWCQVGKSEADEHFMCVFFFVFLCLVVRN